MKKLFILFAIALTLISCKRKYTLEELHESVKNNNTELFSYIKIEIDNGAKAGSFWLTGSPIYKLIKLARQTLAAREELSALDANNFIIPVGML